MSIGKQIAGEIACKIAPVLDKSLKDINLAAKNIKLKSKKNVFLSFALTVAILLVALAGVAYIWKFHDGTKIAEKRVEKMLENEKESIRRTAVEQYKNSLSFRKDACKEVAENIGYTNVGYYLFAYIQKTDIKRYRLDEFYKFLKSSADQYKAAIKE